MLSSTFRLLTRTSSFIRPVIGTLPRRSLFFKPTLVSFNEKQRQPSMIINHIPVRQSHVHYTYPMIESRVMLVLRLFDKIDGNALQLDSKFAQDLGLDSLDIVEITAALEDEFWTEIPDVDSDHFVTPRHIIQYLCDKYDVYEHVEPVSAGKEYMEEAKAAAERAHHH
ncbi:unnamed protein product [Adineta ricciae]|uniref:Acyl carrier protein n=1 Tax=Adineta ricciae TaxID=249248 RepID=A0A814QK34_ADIRI|nr:unnamed protein product [Adineta ricciae]CAF1121396.1 unnamed protein product [Adineta ricciae]